MKRPLIRALAFLVLSLFAFHTTMAYAKELKAVCFLPKNHPLAVMTLEWVQRINTYCYGELRIDYLEGSEAIPPLEQVEALRKGHVQVAFIPTAYYQSVFPEGAAFALSKFTPWEERVTDGFYELMVLRHRKINAMYLGRCMHSPSYLWLKDPVKTPKDLEGRKLRTMAPYDRFMKALGAIPVTISMDETYKALQRGRVTGFGWPLIGARNLGWTEVCKYIIDHPFFNQNVTILMNLGSWNSLSTALQQKIVNLTTWYEPYMVGYFDSSIAAEWKELEKTGVKRIRFSSSEAQAYLNAAYEVEWEALKEKVPDLVPLLRLLTDS
jgi:TRAP-type C4-dicarboxylate transport system substrate-binding protein